MMDFTELYNMFKSWDILYQLTLLYVPQLIIHLQGTVFRCLTELNTFANLTAWPQTNKQSSNG